MALSALVFTIKGFAYVGQTWWVPFLALFITVVTGTIFVRRQQRLRFPLLDFTIFRNKAFTSGVIAAALTMFAISGLQLVITQRFQLVNGFSPMESGLLVSVAAMGAIPTALLGGAYLHKIGLRILIVGGLGFSVPAVLLAIWAINQSVCWMIVSLLLIGVGLGASMSVASTAIIGNAPVQRAGMAASVEEVSYEFGGLIAIALLGSLLAAIYTTTIVLPEGSFDAARDSMAAAALLAAHTPTDGVLIFSAAAEAFDRGVYAVMTVIAVVLILAALITGTLLRNYGPGSVSSLYSEHHYEDK